MRVIAHRGAPATLSQENTVEAVPWRVNRRRDAQRLARLGVTGVITDVPQPVRAACATVAGQRT